MKEAAVIFDQHRDRIATQEEVLIGVLLEYIGNQDSSEAFEDFLVRKAEEIESLGREIDSEEAIREMIYVLRLLIAMNDETSPEFEDSGADFRGHFSEHAAAIERGLKAAEELIAKEE